MNGNLRMKEDFLNRNHLLIVDDDDRIRALLKEYLRRNGFFVCIASDTKKARKYMEKYIFDMMILDVMMPDETGLQFLNRVRNEENNDVPILMLTALGETNDKIDGLEKGADDYLVKPFEPKELILRIKNILSRTKKDNGKNIISFGEFKFDLNNLKLEKNNEIIYLTELEKTLLKIFCEKPNFLFEREKLCSMFNGINERSID